MLTDRINRQGIPKADVVVSEFHAFERQSVEVIFKGKCRRISSTTKDVAR